MNELNNSELTKLVEAMSEALKQIADVMIDLNERVLDLEEKNDQ